jgi:DNA primase
MDTVDIVALIESYGLPEFRRTSTSYSTGDSTGFHDKATCLCPFHNDKNPSLKIDGERGIYKCFSCGAGGNALGFVREYSERYHDDNDNNDDDDEDEDDAANKDTGKINAKNPVTSKPLTFMESVRVLEDFVTIPIDGVQRRRQRRKQGIGNTQNKTKKQKSMVGSTPKERILLANLHAAAFFEECLFSLPSAGIARTHLRSRGVHPTTVKAFAIGFAPESYFLQQQSRPWGEGSLVYRLRDEGFTPQEIVDAGLATVTRKGKEKQEQQRLAEESRGEKSSNENNDNNDDVIIKQQPQHQDFTTLMDRFRGRLVVPIFDETGTQILGFGGRILETSREASSDYKAAKYLNSPESLVFLKKELLFARHMVKFVTPPPSTTTGKDSLNVTKTATATKRRLRSLIIVEGYMDAIALWQAGVKEAVASMGTALSHEQLLAAASTARKIGGRLICSFALFMLSQ